jgi:adenylate cyclase
MLPTIDLKAPPRDDPPFEEATYLVGTNLALRSSVGQKEAISPPYGRYVPSFPEIVSRPAEPTIPATPYPRAATRTDCAAVLVADDFEANRRTVARNLKMQGHAVTTAENGRQALALLRERLFDLVLLDIVMPEMDGYQVLEQIRADPRLRHIPVVVISAVEEMSSIVRCIELGAADYLFKPFDPGLLNARVSACLEYKRLRDQEQALLRQIQAERARSENLLLNILPGPIAERLKQGQHRIAQYFDDVTVLFADLVGFTQLAERIAPAVLLGLLDEIFSIFDDLAERYGLEKIKTIGDAYMVAGGLPRPSLHHADAVADMALAMQDAIAVFGARHCETYQLRIGMSSGPAVAGVIGQKKFTYDLWGDTVNIASRMESLGQAGRIHISAATQQRLGNRYYFEERGPLYVKGKGEMETHFLIGKH